MRCCVGIPASRLVPSAKIFCAAQVSVGAHDMSHWFGDAGMPLCGELGGAVEVQAVAILLMR